MTGDNPLRPLPCGKDAAVQTEPPMPGCLTTPRLAWPPDYVDMRGLAYMLSTSTKQVQRMLSAGRLPAADVNLSAANSFKGRRWRRDRVIAFLEGRRPC